MNKVGYQVMYDLVDIARISQRYSVASNSHSLAAMTDCQSVVFDIPKSIQKRKKRGKKWATESENIFSVVVSL